MNSGYRQGRPGDEDKILDFANMVFSMAHRPHDFAQLLPKVYGRSDYAPKHVLYESEAGDIEGLVGLHVVDMRVGESNLRCGVIGTVSAHPRFRGRGHMKQLMPMAEQLARDADCELMLLGGQRQRYNYFGYEQGGVSVRVEVTRDNLRHTGPHLSDGISFIPLAQASPEVFEAAYGFYGCQTMTGIRGREAFRVTLCSWQGEGYAVMHSDKVIGYLYAVDGGWREFVLTHDVEIGSVLAAWQSFAGSTVTSIRLGMHQRALLECLGHMAEEVVMEDSHMLRVLNWQAVLQKLLTFRHRILPPEEGDKIVEIDGERLRLHVSAHGVLVKPSAAQPMVSMTHNQAVTRLFSVQSAWQPDRKMFDDWLPLWFTLPEADGF